MATNKNNEPTKVMDVSRPGRSTPPTSAKPIIVTNRPILRQDPMMAAPDGGGKTSTPVAKAPVSRTAKTLQVLTPSDDLKLEPELPQTPTETLPEADGAPVSASPVQISPMPSAEPKAGELTLEIDAPAKPVETAEAKPLDQKPAEPSVTAEASEAPPAAVPPSPVSDAVAPASPANTEATKDEDDETEPDSTEQLAPNQALEESKRQEEDAQTARLAEEEKIVASKQYYLPMNTVEKRRGLDRVLLILALVLLLALIWADIVLDAGIIHVNGLHAVTHFFTK